MFLAELQELVAYGTAAALAGQLDLRDEKHAFVAMARLKAGTTC